MSKVIDDPLKELSEITKPDSRQHFFNTTLELNHEELTSIQLHSGVPKEVRQLFETAKNISLYSWYVYRFHQVSELITFTALEMALRLKYENEVSEKSKKKMTLSPLLQHAKERGWITNQGFPSFEVRLKQYAEQKKNELRAMEHDFDSEPEMQWEEPTQEEISDAFNEFDLVDAIASNAHHVRNSLAHGSTTLHPGSVSTLFLVHEVINQLFQPHENSA